MHSACWMVSMPSIVIEIQFSYFFKKIWRSKFSSYSSEDVVIQTSNEGKMATIRMLESPLTVTERTWLCIERPFDKKKIIHKNILLQYLTSNLKQEYLFSPCHMHFKQLSKNVKDSMVNLVLEVNLKGEWNVSQECHLVVETRGFFIKCTLLGRLGY